MVTQMPCLNYRWNGCAVRVDDIPRGEVDVLQVNGEWKRVPWLGFVCEKGAKMLSVSRPGKIRAARVSNGSLMTAREWRTLSGDEYVLGMLCPLHDRFGVFAVVDKDGWPIVKGSKKPPLKLVS